MRRYGKPEIFNTDQGVQFTCEAFIGALSAQGIRISMDGKGRCLDNIFCERLWRSLKYEEVYLKAYAGVAEAKTEIGEWFKFYNDERPHQALDYLTPRQFFTAAQACVDVGNAPQIIAGLRDQDSLQLMELQKQDFTALCVMCGMIVSVEIATQALDGN